ncbi:DUF2336 domain-containing protein [Roseospira goensis]|uniref:Uncharacterized protein (DUF2336 family) n=1 Tax=Roseospira goensis TaxID=391922 RepID=A0A7W6RZM6_9PROT|nr:DUF2336 domain-containing protein [Roseospira goensis]MBB4286016.1 uncharacterized protein (DUF2336 family) [Roseospira goensis]
MTELLRRLFDEADERPLSYEESRSLAAHADVTVRRTLARRTDVRPEVLYYLAEDADAGVRRNIADNVAAPLKAYLLLTEDSDPDVRLTLVQRITALAPGLSEDEKDRVRQHVHTALGRLARDQIPKVRALLSEAVKDLAAAPPEVIKRLARDAEVAVAAPVLTFSPVLSDGDLLDIIHDGPTSGHLSAIARRSAGLAAPVSDALVATDDTAAIADLLANRGAQIREETLDALIDRAATVPEWHAPLVHRPSLPADAGRRLALYVSDTLVQALMLRRDLTPGDALAVAAEVRRRLSKGWDPEMLMDYGPDWREALRAAHARARQDIAEGVPGEALLHAAMASNERTEAIAALAAMAGIDPLAAAATVRAASPKGIISVAWKAGVSAAVAAELQRWLGAIPPQEVLGPDPEGGGYPLAEAEMDWQVTMFCDTEAESGAVDQETGA